MARIRESKEPTPLTINQFLGLNLAVTGDTQLTLGESGNMKNCYITDDYNLSKIIGYSQLMYSMANKPIRGMWHGNLNNKNYFLFALDGRLYKFHDNHWLNLKDDTIVADYIGDLTDEPTHFFSFSGFVYILNGYEYKRYNGYVLEDVEGYTPKINIGCNPSTGTGLPFEGLNLLNGKKHQTYHGDNKTKLYKLPENNLNSIDKVIVNGELKSPTTDYTINLLGGNITFVSAPSEGQNNVDIFWTKGNGNREEITNNRFSFLFGTASDTRVFLYGNKNKFLQNKRVFSSLADGVPSVEYFVATSVEDCGSNSTPITGMERQQSRFLIHKTDETYYSFYDSVNIDGVDVVNFPAFIVNDKRGNIPMGQGQVLNNDPFTIDNSGFLKWIPTEIKDERNAKDMGLRIQRDLNDIDLSKCLTVDKENSKELYISCGKTVWIYKYDLSNPKTKQQGVFSKLILEDEPTCWLAIDNNLYFGTTNGKIMKFDDKYLTFNGKTIDCHWEMNMYDFGANWLKKTLNKSWITLSPKPKSNIEIQYITDKNAYSNPYIINYDTVTFGNIDFANFTFYTNFNPQAFYIRLKAKKFVYLKLVIDNTQKDSTFTITNLTLKTEYGNESK